MTTVARDRDLRAVLAMADKLLARAREIEAIARQVRGNVIAEKTQWRDQIGAVLSVVAEVCGVSVPAIKTKRRYKSLVRVRSLACLAARNYTPASYPQIGRVIGRDHTTVMHACSEAEKLIATDPQMAEWWADIERRLAG